MARMMLSRVNVGVGAVTTSSPSRRTVILSEIASASSNAWLMKMIETPRAFNRLTRLKKCCFSSGVSVAVGSSKMMTLAFSLTARAISTICFLAAPSVATVAQGSTLKFSDCRNCCAAM